MAQTQFLDKMGCRFLPTKMTEKRMQDHLLKVRMYLLPISLLTNHPLTLVTETVILCCLAGLKCYERVLCVHFKGSSVYTHIPIDGGRGYSPRRLILSSLERRL